MRRQAELVRRRYPGFVGRYRRTGASPAGHNESAALLSVDVTAALPRRGSYMADWTTDTQPICGLPAPAQPQRHPLTLPVPLTRTRTTAAAAASRAALRLRRRDAVSGIKRKLWYHCYRSFKRRSTFGEHWKM